MSGYMKGRLGRVPVVCEHCHKMTPKGEWHYCDYCGGDFCDDCLTWFKEGAGTLVCPACLRDREGRSE